MPRPDGTPTIAELILDDDDLDPRADKPWPADQDCTHCPGQKGGQHKFGCAVGRMQQVKLNAVQDPDGKFRVV